MTPIMRAKILQTLESEGRVRPSGIDFELAYQARVAMDRIRFAIRQTEAFGSHSDQVREAGLQLLDALNRLESVDRRFQNLFTGQVDARAENVSVGIHAEEKTRRNGDER